MATTQAAPQARSLDMIIVGAGFAGLYMLHKARQLGLDARVLEAGSGVTQGAVSQHLKQLRQAGLVAERPEGRNVFYRAAPGGLAPLADWMNHYAVFWRERFDSLRALLEEIDPPDAPRKDTAQ